VLIVRGTPIAFPVAFRSSYTINSYYWRQPICRKSQDTVAQLSRLSKLCGKCPAPVGVFVVLITRRLSNFVRQLLGLNCVLSSFLKDTKPLSESFSIASLCTSLLNLERCTKRNCVYLQEIIIRQLLFIALIGANDQYREPILSKNKKQNKKKVNHAKGYTL
jgi:hypothetical protein